MILLKIQPCSSYVEMDDDINHSLGLQGNCLDVDLPGCVPKETSIRCLRFFALLLPPASRSALQMAGVAIPVLYFIPQVADPLQQDSENM